MKNKQRPNVIMLVADDHQAAAMGCSGHPEVRTPHLDSLAARGAIFRHAYHMGGCDDAVCIPSRASLLTGLKFDEAMTGERGVIDSDRVTLPQHFKNEGYTSYGIGKWHNDKASLTRSFSDGGAIFLGGMEDHFKLPLRPFDPSGVFPGHQIVQGERFSQEIFCDEACRFIESYDGGEPFFLYTAFTAPHDPRTPPSEFQKLYDSANISLPPNFRPEHPFDLDVSDLRDECLGPNPREEAFMREDLASYYAMISALDEGVGQILESLRKTGLLENSIVLYTGDHGLAMGQHGLLGKQNMYEHSMQVPFILSGLGIPAGERHLQRIYSRDAYATLCRLCELPLPEGLDSNDAFRYGRNEICGQYMEQQRMVIRGDWKLISVSVKGNSHLQLFNLREDPWELNNRAGDEGSESLVQGLLACLEENSVGLPADFDVR